MALLSGARVLAIADTAAAEETFAAGVKPAASLPLEATHRALLLEEAVQPGTMAGPRSAAVLFPHLTADGYPDRRSSTGSMLVQSLARSGDFSDRS